MASWVNKQVFSVPRQLVAAGYVEGLKKEYPEAQISQFVIYCFGNQGFRVFAVRE